MKFKNGNILAPASLLLLCSAAYLQANIETIYWTGNEDRWGTSPHHSFSTVPGGGEGTYYDRVRGYNELHMVYDRNNMVGENTGVLMNRLGVVMHSVTLIGIGTGIDSGFLLQKSSNESNNYDFRLAGPINVVSGTHIWRDQPGTEAPEFSPIDFTVPALWTVESDAEMFWSIPLSERQGSFGLTKQGEGVLRMSGTHAYTGLTQVNEGGFGAYDSNLSLADSLHFAAGANYAFNIDAHIDAGGSITFADFGVDNLVDIPADIISGTYPLIYGPVDFSNIRNLGSANSAVIFGETKGYFENIEGAMYLVIDAPVPENWAHYIVDEDFETLVPNTDYGYSRYQLNVDAGGFLGRINVGFDGAKFEDWIHVYSIGSWVHLPVERVSQGGSWVFFPEQE